MKYCKKCLTPTTRPRVHFNHAGICNACTYAETAPTIDWASRWSKLLALCDQFRGAQYHDCIVPVSGGKDGSHVAHTLKHTLGMNPLCISISPPLQTQIGRHNLDNFRNSGYDLIEIRPDPHIYKSLCKQLFIEQARCKFPFVIGISTAIIKESTQRQIPLVFWGEQGEEIYGGDPSFNDSFFIPYEFITKCYHEGIKMSDYTSHHLWQMPKQREVGSYHTWWSKWELWDDQLHRDTAINHCGMTVSDGEVGTFTNYSQLDDVLQDLHMYECFLKFGTGRATADVNLAIHAGRMTRAEGVEIVRSQDGVFPIEYLDTYLDFFQMTAEEFWMVIDSHANRDILLKMNEKSQPWILKEEAI